MIRTPLTLICFALIFAGALLHGKVTQRWDILTPDDSRIEKLHDVFIQFRGFSNRDIPSDMPVKERSHVTCRQYFSDVTNNSFVVSVTTGISGSVATHTPDVCYVGSGYRMTRPIARKIMSLPSGGSATYYVAEFEKKRATGIDRQRVRWAWTADGIWDAPDSPRFRYMRTGELAKVYIVTAVTNSGDDSDSAITVEFTASVFDQLSKSMTP
jgi:hypothetical protein